MLDRAALRVRRGEIHAAQACEGDGAGAHGAGLERHVEVAADEAFAAELPCGFADDQHLRMRCRVAVGERAVAGAGQDLATRTSAAPTGTSPAAAACRALAKAADIGSMGSGTWSIIAIPAPPSCPTLLSGPMTDKSNDDGSRPRKPRGGKGGRPPGRGGPGKGPRKDARPRPGGPKREGSFGKGKGGAGSRRPDRDGAPARVHGERPARADKGERGSFRPREDRPRSDRPQGEKRFGDRPDRSGERGSFRRPSDKGGSFRPRDDRPRPERAHSGERPDRARGGDRGDFRPRESDRKNESFRPREDRPRQERPRSSDRPERHNDGERRLFRPRDDRPRQERPRRTDKGGEVRKGSPVTPRTHERGEGEERIAKVMARAGLCSRRDAETWITEGRVEVNGKVLESPAYNVGPGDRVVVDGKLMAARERTRLWLFHKPRGLVTTRRDPEGR